MLRGLYTSAAGMITQQRKHDTITNNIANLNTPGFKQNYAVSRAFPEMLISLIKEGDKPGASAMSIGRINSGVFAEENLAVYLQGDLHETGNPFDIAIKSDIQVPGLQFDPAGKAFNADGEKVFQPLAFFTVMNNGDQQRYTRNGKFSISADGEFVTADGYRVLGRDGQPIVFNNLSSDAIAISRNGSFFNAITGQPLLNDQDEQYALLISRVDNPHRLVREGSGLYRLEDGQEQAVEIGALDQVEVFQGFIELSNVDPTQSMVDMMTAQRAYEANQRMIQYYDRSLEKAVNEVGRV